MSSDPVAATALPEGPPSESDYDAVYAALSATARGRSFLAEYARRSRTEDLRSVLDALAGMASATSDSAPPPGAAATGDELAASANRVQTENGVPRPRWYMEVPDFAISPKNSAADEPSAARLPDMVAAEEKEDSADPFDIAVDLI